MHFLFFTGRWVGYPASRRGAAPAHVNERRSATLAPGAENGAGVTAGGPENPGNAVTLAIFAGAGWLFLARAGAAPRRGAGRLLRLSLPQIFEVSKKFRETFTFRVKRRRLERIEERERRREQRERRASEKRGKIAQQNEKILKKKFQK